MLDVKGCRCGLQEIDWIMTPVVAPSFDTRRWSYRGVATLNQMLTCVCVLFILGGTIVTLSLRLVTDGRLHRDQMVSRRKRQDRPKANVQRSCGQLMISLWLSQPFAKRGLVDAENHESVEGTAKDVKNELAMMSM